MRLNALGWSQVYQLRLFHPHCISTFQIHLIDYPDQDFTKLKYSNTSTLIIWRGQSHLDPHIDFVSTWLYRVAFHHYTINTNNPAPKYNELLVSHYGDLWSEGYLCSYALRAVLDSRALSRWVTYSMIMYFYILSICYTNISILLD